MRKSWQQTSQPKPLSRTPRRQVSYSSTSSNVKQPAQGSHIYLTGISDANGNELMYFDIPVIPSNAADQ